MKIIFASFLLISSFSAFADSKPCLSQARQAVYENLSEITEDSHCEVKLKKVSQTLDEVSYSADISGVNGGGFFNKHDFIEMKFEKLPSGKYNCKMQ